MSCSLECDKNLLTEKQNEQLNTIQPISFSKWVSFRKSKSFRRSFRLTNSNSSSRSLNSENDNINNSISDKKPLCSLNEKNNNSDDSDNSNSDEYDDDLMNNISSPVSSVCKACLYYLEAEIEATPEMLEKIIKNRTLRGLYEIIGFKYLTKILSKTPLPMDILYFYNCINIIFYYFFFFFFFFFFFIYLK